MTFGAVIPQSGVVVDCEQLVDVRLSDGSVVHDAPSSMLQPIVPFELDQGVLYRGWLGYVMEVWPPTQGLDHCYAPKLVLDKASLATIPSLHMHKALGQFDADGLVEIVMQKSLLDVQQQLTASVVVASFPDTSLQKLLATVSARPNLTGNTLGCSEEDSASGKTKCCS